jgi:branched-chain amino acid transport system permease protein
MDILWQLLLQGLAVSVVYLLIASGFSVIYSTTDHFHISHAGVFTLAGYLLFLFAQVLGLPILLAFILALASSALVGVLILRGLYYQVITRGGTKLVLFIASLGLLAVIDNGMVAIFSPDPQVIDSSSIYSVLNIFGGSITSIQLYLIFTGVLALAALYIFMNRTKTGRLIKAVSANPELAQVVGISIKKVHTICYAIGSALVAIPGFYFALDAGAQAGRGIELVILSVMAVIMGGIGSLIGCWLIAMTLGLFYNLSIIWITPHWQTSIIFTIFLFVIMYKPTGLFGKQA